MNDNEINIVTLDGSIKYYKKHMNEATNGVSRKSYKDMIKSLEVSKQLAILRERNIKG